MNRIIHPRHHANEPRRKPHSGQEQLGSNRKTCVQEIPKATIFNGFVNRELSITQEQDLLQPPFSGSLIRSLF